MYTISKAVSVNNCLLVISLKKSKFIGLVFVILKYEYISSIININWIILAQNNSIVEDNISSIVLLNKNNAIYTLIISVIANIHMLPIIISKDFNRLVFNINLTNSVSINIEINVLIPGI